MPRNNAGLVVSMCKNTQPDLVVNHNPDDRWSEEEQISLRRLIRAVVYNQRRDFVIEFREPGRKIVQIRLNP